VAFTFNYGKKHPVADQQGLWSSKTLSSVTASGNKVSINLTTVDTTVFYKIANQVLIIPQHIWANVADPATFRNPNPVGTGPFTQLTDFSTQSFVLAKNPYYWQPLYFDGIKVPALTGNQAANLAMVNGQLDWTGNFVPSCEKVYTAKDPAHFHCAYATVGPVALWFNDLQYPFSMPDFRKAMSYAIDRNKIYQIAEYGYETPSDASGITGPWPTWADPALAAQAKEMATYNPTKAMAILTKAGFTTKSGKLYDPKGKQVTYTLSVPNGWSDWVLGIQIIQSEMKALGIDVTINLPTASSWTEMTAKDTLPGGGGQLHWTTTLADPYEYYRDFMSQESYYPVGTDATLNGTNNYARYASPQVSALLKQFRQTSDLATQQAAIHKIEAIQLQDMPMIPLVYSASWYTYSTLHFTGWPTLDNMFTAGSPNIQGTTWKVLTSLKPVM
jgi:peptide/nickel transport system substrate-binding protein